MLSGAVKLTRHQQQKNDVSSSGNSLDWDSPSAVTGTVKRRPVSGSSDCDCVQEICVARESEKSGTSFVNFGGCAGKKTNGPNSFKVRVSHCRN